VNWSHIPAALVTDEKVTSCHVSSHLFLACVAVASSVHCFHVSTGRYIRTIRFSGEVLNLLINDTLQILFGVGANFIDVFTINQTQIAHLSVDDPIQASSLSLNPVSVFLATGHASGHVCLWEVDAQNGTLIKQKDLDYQASIRAIRVVSAGSAIFALGHDGRARVSCARGIQRSIFKVENAVACAGCGGAGSLLPCSSCGLYFCGKCCQKAKVALCNQCLEHITEYSMIIDDDF
jgi:WD40 repeat protein